MKDVIITSVTDENPPTYYGGSGGASGQLGVSYFGEAFRYSLNITSIITVLEKQKNKRNTILYVAPIESWPEIKRRNSRLSTQYRWLLAPEGVYLGGGVRVRIENPVEGRVIFFREEDEEQPKSDFEEFKRDIGIAVPKSTIDKMLKLGWSKPECRKEIL